MKLFSVCCDEVKEFIYNYQIVSTFSFIFKIFKLKSTEFWLQINLYFVNFRLLQMFTIENNGITKKLIVFAGIYNNSCLTVSKLIVSKIDSQFDRVVLSMSENEVVEKIECCNTYLDQKSMINFYSSFFTLILSMKLSFGVMRVLYYRTKCIYFNYENCTHRLTATKLTNSTFNNIPTVIWKKTKTHYFNTRCYHK